MHLIYVEESKKPFIFYGPPDADEKTFADVIGDLITASCLLSLSLLDALVAMEKAMKRDKIIVNDRQLACARIASQEGQDYLKGMAAAGNYAWVNRSSMTFLTRQVRSS